MSTTHTPEYNRLCLDCNFIFQGPVCPKCARDCAMPAGVIINTPPIVHSTNTRSAPTKPLEYKDRIGEIAEGIILLAKAEFATWGGQNINSVLHGVQLDIKQVIMAYMDEHKETARKK